MKTCNALLALAFVFSGSAAASAAGDNVVTLNVGKVVTPNEFPGLCDVSAVIDRVMQGATFHSGQAISLKVPCSSGAPTLTPAVAVITGGDNIYFVPAPMLKNSHLGLARLDDGGSLIWSATGKSFAPWGPAYGYRIVDGVALPAR